MRLHDFIRDHREEILAEWESFARTLTPASHTMDVVALRDHADEMLTVIAETLKTAPNPNQQSKNLTILPTSAVPVPTAATVHGAGRAESGFTIDDVVAEYRALRASVLTLWTREIGELRTENIADLIRFNAAIDQSLAESVAEFNENVEEAKEMFLAILGHDLRNPLGAISTSAKHLLESGDDEEPRRSLATLIATSATRTVGMVGDLLDFARSRLGGGIPVDRQEMDVRKLLRAAVEEVSAVHRDRQFRVDTPTEQIGEWDGARLSQALTNLIVNAGEHAPPGTTISVGLADKGDGVAIAIHNMGPTIPGDRLDGLFNPMKTEKGGSKAASGGPTGNLGLGLYIAERIVHGHGGWIEVDSAEAEGTTFTVHLPRRE
jgi:signal transduction histidine kinase